MYRLNGSNGALQHHHHGWKIVVGSVWIDRADRLSGPNVVWLVHTTAVAIVAATGTKENH